MINNVKVFALMAALTALLGAIGAYFGGSGGLTMALLFAAVMNVGMYFWSGTMVLRMYGARVVTAAEAPELYAVVDTLRQRAGLPMPTVAVAPHAQANAFATGRNPEHAVVCVTEGLLKLIGREELEGVIAHELAHIKNRDMLLQTVTATMVGAISNLMWFGASFGDDDDRNPAFAIVAMIGAWLAATVIQMAISRSREFKADAVGAEISGQPLALAGALRKLEATARAMPMHVSPAAAPLAQVNPLAGGSARGIMRLFLTHPPTEDRVRALEAIATGRARQAAL